VTHSPRILIFYAEAGAGHRRAAEALAQPLIERDAEVALHDAMRYTHPLFRAVYRGGGLSLITRLPRLYHLAYHLSDQPAIDRVLRGPRYHSQQISTRQLFHMLEVFQPDAIICTHFLPAELCAGWRRSGRLPVPLCTVVTDFDPHFMWQHAGTDWYYVSTDEARARLIQDGIDPAIVEVTGIPIGCGFAALPDRSSAARRLNLDPDRAIVLIMGGGLGVGALDAVARSLLARPLDAQIVFITGSNHVLRRRLKAMSRSLAVRADADEYRLDCGEAIEEREGQWIVRGFVNNMPDWLAAADVAISKAGGLAGSELLAAGVPTIIPRMLTGHEAMNAQYLASTGAALLVDSAAEASAQADRLLREPRLREAMRCAARQAARPFAATLIADHVLNRARFTHYTLPVTKHVDRPSLSTL
jgi:processive 1,2-diacylglycerol beta-glucosyltransferase